MISCFNLIHGYNTSMSAPPLRKILSGLPIPKIHYLSETGSTNEDALQWAIKGAPEGVLVVADSQTCGRGRFERQWITLPGSALAFSLILKPTPQEIEHLTFFSPLGALAVSQALIKLGVPDVRVKWPNDVLIKGSKVCGVLAESSWQEDQLLALVVGIGVNVAIGSVPPADKLLFPATCIEAEIGRGVDRWQLLRDILAALFDIRKILSLIEFIELWQKMLAFVGEMVTIETQKGKSIQGKNLGITAHGELCLQLDNGEEEAFAMGDVSLQPKTRKFK